MATQVQNAIIILDALADSRGKVYTTQQKIDFVEYFVDMIAGSETNEEKAEVFIATLGRIIIKSIKAHARTQEESNQSAAVDAAGELAITGI